MEETISVDGGERIARIQVYPPNEFFPIHTWRVFFKGDMSIGLFLLKPEDFTGKDREALQAAFRKAEEYRKKNKHTLHDYRGEREDTVHRINNNLMCCGCTIM